MKKKSKCVPCSIRRRKYIPSMMKHLVIYCHAKKEVHCTVLYGLQAHTVITGFPSLCVVFASLVVLCCVVLSCLVLFCLIRSCLVLSYFFMSYRLLPCLALSYRSCLTVSCLTVSCLVLSFLVLLSIGTRPKGCREGRGQAGIGQR